MNIDNFINTLKLNQTIILRQLIIRQYYCFLQIRHNLQINIKNIEIPE